MLDIEKIKILCGLKGMTQSSFAEELNITQSYLSYLLNGKRKGSIEIASNMARVLGVSMDDLVIASNSPLFRREKKRKSLASKRQQSGGIPPAA